MSFKFRFAGLLSYREHLKEKAEIEHAKTLGALFQAREALAALQWKYDRVRTDFKQTMAQATSGPEIRNFSDYLDSLREKMEKKSREIEALKSELEIKRSALLKKSKEYKVIETLKEKDFEKWQKHQDHLEQIRLNEIAVQRHGKAFI